MLKVGGRMKKCQGSSPAYGRLEFYEEVLVYGRSFKHTPVYQGDKSRFEKKYANRRLRRNGKIKHGDLKAGKSKYYKKLNESWHICDYRTWGEPIWRRESCKNLSDWPEIWRKCYRSK